MKKLSAFFAILLLSFAILFAQVGSDPADEFYDYVEKWEGLGLISEQPPLRPYSLQLIEKILETVIQSDNADQAAAADQIYARIFKKSFHVRVEEEGQAKLSSGDKTKQIMGIAGLDGNYEFPKLVALSYKMGIIGATNSNLNYLPMYTAIPYYMRDPASLGSVDAYIEMDGNISVGTDKFYLQAGVNHNSFGPFYDDSTVLSPNTKHTANFSFVYNPGMWSYTQALLGLSASNATSDDLFSQKYLAIHSVNGQICQWLSAAFYEVSIFGGRFEPAYLIPVPFMITQGLSGFDDNIFMGLTINIKPVTNLTWSNDFFIDDLSVNDLVKFKFDTKIRGTFQTGLKYVPENLSFLGPVKLNYTLITPYMYTHKQNLIDSATGDYKTGTLSVINYQEYTTAGYALGSSLSPNTDKVAISAVFTPIKGLNVNFSGAFIRHANVNESLEIDEAISYLNSPAGYFTTDGGIHNHCHYLKNGQDGEYSYLPSAWNRFMFMTQETKMYTVQAGLDIDYTLPTTKFGNFSVGLAYLFEYIHNYGVDNQIFIGDGGNHTEADVYAALAEWKSNLTDVFNHYVSLSFKYTW